MFDTSVTPRATLKIGEAQLGPAQFLVESKISGVVVPDQVPLLPLPLPLTWWQRAQAWWSRRMAQIRRLRHG